ncbi:MAG: ribonuclease HII [Deltaproteobacteria bacterium]|nr:ribonuclease HII [Deltaproteobacteria bacterium]
MEAVPRTALLVQIPLFSPGVIACGEVEIWARERGMGPLIGLDEAGRGPLAGPVVAAACVLPDPCPFPGLDDSKQLTEARREELFALIVEHAVAFGVCFAEPDLIDEINILRASLHAMSVAWQMVVDKVPSLRTAHALVDGKMRAPLPEDVVQHVLVKGDGRSLNVAAASILAKVSRDRAMREYDAEFPVYGFAKHKGYPTKQHLSALAEHGPCPIHRRSFRLTGPEVAAVPVTTPLL